MVSRQSWDIKNLDLVCSEIAVLKVLAAQLRKLEKDDLADKILTDSSLGDSLLYNLKYPCESLKRMSTANPEAVGLKPGPKICTPLVKFLKEHDLPIECGFKSLSNEELKELAIHGKISKENPVAVRVVNPRGLHTINIVGFDNDRNEFLYDEEIPHTEKTPTNFAPENILRVPKRKIDSRYYPFFGAWSLAPFFPPSSPRESFHTWRFKNQRKKFELPQNYAFMCKIREDADGNK